MNKGDGDDAHCEGPSATSSYESKRAWEDYRKGMCSFDARSKGQPGRPLRNGIEKRKTRARANSTSEKSIVKQSEGWRVGHEPS